MPVAACPSPETLAAFARGDLSADQLDGVAGHVDGCAACAAALRGVPEDSLAGLARAAASDPNTVVADPGATAARAGGVPAGFAGHPRYRLLGELGAGGMGTVYKAEDTWMGRVIAIKVVSPHLTAKAAALDRFRKEVRVAAQLNDARVIIAHDTGEAGGCQFLVMEYVDGVSLDRLVAKKGPLSVPMACAFTRQAALGLQHAADKGMVHRDVKPQNLMVTRKGQVKILDFGLARFAHPDEPDELGGGKLPFGAGKAPAAGGVTSPNVLMGTPDYLSPEQAKSSNVDHRSDIYSLGCTLYFLLTGRPPFGSAATLVDKLLAHTHDAPASPRDARPEIPDGLDSVLAKMMAKRPEDRYQTAAEVAAALLPFTRADAGKEPVFEVVEAAVVTPGPRSVVTPVPSDTAPVSYAPTVSDRPRPRRPKRKRRSWWRRRRGAVLGGALAALFVVAAVVLARGRAKPTESPADPTASAKAPAATPPDGKGGPPDAKSDRTKGEKTAAAPPTVVAPPARAPRVLFVLPSDGLWLDDFLPVRDHFAARGATVVTASHAGGVAKPAPQTPGPPVAVDVLLRPDMDLSEYSAVLFCGERVDEYLPNGRAGAAAGKVIQRMQAAGKPVGSICAGGAVLAAHGTLKGKRAAHSRPLSDRYPFVESEKVGAVWGRPGVAVDGAVVTASGPREAVPFADAVLRLIDAK